MGNNTNRPEPGCGGVRLEALDLNLPVHRVPVLEAEVERLKEAYATATEIYNNELIHLQAEVERLKKEIALSHPIARLGTAHGDMTLGEIAELNQKLEAENDALKKKVEELDNEIL